MARRRASFPSTLAPSAIPIVVVFLTFCVGNASAGEADAEYDYKDPSKWGTMKKDWALCGSGTEQSPIDITKVEASKDLGPLKPIYEPGNATIINTGHDFMMSFKGGDGKLVIRGKEYKLQFVHFHAPSEHTINGTAFDAEMHMVHEGRSKALAVISVLFSSKAGKQSKLLSDIGPYFKRLSGKKHSHDKELVKGFIDPTSWVDEASDYYRYNGSLTTPPCTEGVIWSIMRKVADASKEQVDLIKSVSKPPESGSRPVQKIYKRVVKYYEAGGSSNGKDKKEPKSKAASR